MKSNTKKVTSKDYLIDDILTPSIAICTELEKIKLNCKKLGINLPKEINYSNRIEELTKIDRAVIITIFLKRNIAIQYFVIDTFKPSDLDFIPEDLICPEIKRLLLKAYMFLKTFT